MFGGKGSLLGGLEGHHHHDHSHDHNHDHNHEHNHDPTGHHHDPMGEMGHNHPMGQNMTHGHDHSHEEDPREVSTTSTTTVATTTTTKQPFKKRPNRRKPKKFQNGRKGRKFRENNNRRSKNSNLNQLPFNFRIPRTGFSCKGRAPGYYADMEAECTVRIQIETWFAYSNMILCWCTQFFGIRRDMSNNFSGSEAFRTFLLQEAILLQDLYSGSFLWKKNHFMRERRRRRGEKSWRWQAALDIASRFLRHFIKRFCNKK